mmetsp:Transcript_67976/g.113924  ORF Transcript_67976/g.113924 Transcript_67976/m.113924 type:complete len:147 (-) Transcript_67976:97-537(-)
MSDAGTTPAGGDQAKMKHKINQNALFAQYRHAPTSSAAPISDSVVGVAADEWAQAAEEWGQVEEGVISETHIARAATQAQHPQGIQAPITYMDAQKFFFDGEWRTAEVRKPKTHIGAVEKIFAPSLDKHLHVEVYFACEVIFHQSL